MKLPLDDLVPAELQGPFGVTGRYVVGCIRSLRQWMKEAWIDPLTSIHLMHLRC